MRNILLALFAVSAIISGCRPAAGVRGYWSEKTPNIEDIAAAEEEFADFAELALAAPEADAFAAVDQLLRKASKDEVTYIIYTDWIERGFGLVASPCFSCPIFVHAANTVRKQKILDAYLSGEYEKRREFCSHNRIGSKAELPMEYAPEERTLFLVVDQDCPSCRKAMDRLALENEDARLVALCCGHGPLPAEPGWNSIRLPHDQTIFDTAQSPFYFVTDADGIVVITYKSAYDSL